VLPCQLLWRVVMKRAAFIALLVDAVEFCRRGPTTDVLLELGGLSRKLSGRRDRAVADVVDVALPIFGKLRVGKLEQALVRTGLCIRIVARLDLGKCLHHLNVDIEQLCRLLDLGAYVVGVRGAGGADAIWQRYRRPIRRQIGVHDVALRCRLIGLIRQSDIRVECRHLYRRLWLEFGFHRGRRRLDRILCHNRSRQLHSRLWLGLDFHRRRPTLDKTLGHNRSLGNDRRLRHNRSAGYNGVFALPVASANVERKTGHANQNNWQIAIFNDPLRQQTAPSHVRFESFPHSRLHRQEKYGESKSYVSRTPVLIYRQRSADLSLLASDEFGLSQTERNSGERRQARETQKACSNSSAGIRL